MQTTLAILIKQAERRVQARFESLLESSELSVEQWRVLEILGDGEGRAMTELAGEALLNLPALSKMVDRMVSRSLIFRAPDATDRRKVLVFASDRGLELYRQLKPEVDACHADIDAALGAQRAGELKQLLAHLIEGTAAA